VTAFSRATWSIGRLCVTTVRQGANAPVVDGCGIRDSLGRHGAGWCIRLPRTPGIGLVVGWWGWSGPSIATIRRLSTLPVLGRLLFRMRFCRRSVSR
jgi:hypothetical protein